MTEINISKLSNIGNQSLAYDLSSLDRFEKQQMRSHRNNILPLVNKRHKAELRRAAVRNVLICGFFIVLFAGIIVSNTQLNELTSRTGKLKAQNEMLVSEGKRLEAEYNMMIDLKEVERIAVEELYMQKVDISQVEFIDISHEDHGNVIDGKTNYINTLVSDVTSGIATLVSYLE